MTWSSMFDHSYSHVLQEWFKTKMYTPGDLAVAEMELLAANDDGVCTLIRASGGGGLGG